ncbi:Transposase DDE domain-containing protein [Puniceibacterium sediminis]|uniref:Transposase DDE domain-containing protein n=1 Tax=Puniceibacterium sediminis TaxID=1608407 RepID=A0A238ZXD4_9RHOB|nr:Transposase DDE domain-containing protein [Puniceibacterium sediminis]
MLIVTENWLYFANRMGDSCLESSVIAGRHEQTIPLTYKIRKWRAYNEALKRRGSLTIWFDPKMTWEAKLTGKGGRQPTFSDAAIQTCLTMKVLFGMPVTEAVG